MTRPVQWKVTKVLLPLLTWCFVGGAIPFCFVGLQQANLILIWCNQEIILTVILPSQELPKSSRSV